MATQRGSRKRRTQRRESRIAWFVSFCGAVVAVAAGYTLFNAPVFSEVVAAVRTLAVVAGVTVASGGVLAATDRLPAHPVGPMAAAPGALAGGAVALSLERAPTWIHVAAFVGLACGLLGFLLVTYAAKGDNS